MPFRMGPTELIIVLVIIIIIFGAARLPEIGSSMGQAIRGFRKGVSELDEDTHQIEVDYSKEGHSTSNRKTRSNKVG